MKRLNDYRMRLTFIGCVAATVFGSGQAKADFAFGEPTNLGPLVNSPYGETATCLTNDELRLFIDSSRPPGTEARWDVWTVSRLSKSEPWGPAIRLESPINTSHDDFAGFLSSDGLEFYFSSTRPGGLGSNDIWVTRRASQDAPWATPENLGSRVNTSANDWFSALSFDGLELYFNSNRSDGFGDHDLYVSRRVTLNDPWGSAQNLGPAVNSAFSEVGPFISADGLCLFFSGNIVGFHPAGIGRADIWVATRRTQDDEWSTRTNLGTSINTQAHETGPRVSYDGSWLYFSSTRLGSLGGSYGDIYQAPILPIVDLNADSIVDAADMSIMVDHWGEDYSLCDIGPTPLGDGVVDVKDLAVLAEHMGGYQRPIARWALDEREGNVAHDKMGENDASVYGDAVWFPAAGMFGGALLLDGVDDWAFTGPVSQVSSGSFSIVAWVKGWAPGRVIVSQAMASNWLMADAAGNLISEIKCVGRADGPLLSETAVTDGDWHRIAFVWDGSHRTLYVNGTPVAEDAQTGLEISDTGLNFGVGKDYAPETYWSGMIDDIRVYDMALSAEQIAALAH